MISLRKIHLEGIKFIIVCSAIFLLIILNNYLFVYCLRRFLASIRFKIKKESMCACSAKLFTANFT